jgi:oligopeptide transport system ATP-binding protein
MAEPLLEVAGLMKRFAGRGAKAAGVQAVADVHLALARGETLGLVGESGCGKSTLSRLILSLIDSDQGHVRIDGADFLSAPTRQKRLMRRRIQIVFQDALSSLNPRMTVGVNIAEPMRLQGLGKRAEREGEARRLLELVGLRAEDAERYPHEFSGGQCQRSPSPGPWS